MLTIEQQLALLHLLADCRIQVANDDLKIQELTTRIAELEKESDAGLQSN